MTLGFGERSPVTAPTSLAWTPAYGAMGGAFFLSSVRRRYWALHWWRRGGGRTNIRKKTIEIRSIWGHPSGKDRKLVTELAMSFILQLILTRLAIVVVVVVEERSSGNTHDGRTIKGSLKEPCLTATCRLRQHRTVQCEAPAL